MKGRIRIPRLLSPSAPVSELALAMGLALGIVFGAIAGSNVSSARFIVGGLGGLIFFLIAMNGRMTALRLVVIWLIMLGLIRRLLIPFAGWSSQDPLLLVSPAAAVLLWWNARSEAPRRRDALTFCIIFFMFVVLAQVFNPGQSLLDGALACIYWLPPLLWFFVGRTTKLADHKKVANLIMWAAIPVALHGLYQTYFGLLPFEYTWVGVSGFGASIFYEGFKVRSFSTLVSPQEYGAFLSFALLILWGTILKRESRLGLRLLLFAFLTYALFLQGSRSTFGLFGLSLFVTSVLWAKTTTAKVTLVSFAAAVGILMAVAPVPELGDGPVAVVVEHQLTGLLNPTNPDDTGQLHFNMIQDGFLKSFENPMGVGTAPGSVVQIKRTGTSTSTENDVSSIFVSLGVLPGVVYSMFLIFIYAATVRRFHMTRTAYSLTMVGVFIAMFGHIWSGGLYAVSAFISMGIGALSRPWDEEVAVDPEEEAAAIEQDTRPEYSAA